MPVIFSVEWRFEGAAERVERKKPYCYYNGICLAVGLRLRPLTKYPPALVTQTGWLLNLAVGCLGQGGVWRCAVRTTCPECGGSPHSCILPVPPVSCATYQLDKPPKRTRREKG